jgi:hypothetical protein
MPACRSEPRRDQDGRFVEDILREQDVLAIVGKALRGRSVRVFEDADFSAIATTGRATRFTQTRLNTYPSSAERNLQKLIWYVERHRILPQTVSINRFPVPSACMTMICP